MKPVVAMMLFKKKKEEPEASLDELGNDLFENDDLGEFPLDTEEAEEDRKELDKGAFVRSFMLNRAMRKK